MILCGAYAWADFVTDITSIEVNTVPESVFKLCLSLMLGCCVGYERKRRGKLPACAHSSYSHGRHSR